MKKTILMAIAVFTMIACKKEETKEVTAVVPTENFKSFGDSITADGVISKEELLAKFETLKEGDTVEVKFRSEIKDVCQKKGCWMNMSLNDEKMLLSVLKIMVFLCH
nr:DUF4920 domain-containing protein [Flavobacterium piscinae]